MATKPIGALKAPVGVAFGQQVAKEEFYGKDEAEDAKRPIKKKETDFISKVLSNPVFATNWSWPWLRNEYHALTVHRFYLQMVPPVAVDTFYNDRFSQVEIDLKKKLCAENNIKYVCLTPRMSLEEAEVELRG